MSHFTDEPGWRFAGLKPDICPRCMLLETDNKELHRIVNRLLDDLKEQHATIEKIRDLVLEVRVQISALGKGVV